MGIDWSFSGRGKKNELENNYCITWTACDKEYAYAAFSEHSSTKHCFGTAFSFGLPLFIPATFDRFAPLANPSCPSIVFNPIKKLIASDSCQCCYCQDNIIKWRELCLLRICMKSAREGFFGWIKLVLSMFPLSLSRTKTDESLVATTKKFFSKPCKLQVSNWRDMMPEEMSLAICFLYSTVGPSVSSK